MNVAKKDFFNFVRVVGAIAGCALFLACDEIKEESPMSSASVESSSVQMENLMIDSSKLPKPDTARVEMISSSSSEVLSSESDSTEIEADSATIEDDFDLCEKTPQGLLCDKRDGKTYGTVRFGDQLWMAENLNYATPNSWCYGNQEVNCGEFGRLYKWTAALGLPDSFTVVSAADSLTSIRRGACPEGWHIPSDAEMKTFYEFVRRKLLVKDSLREGVGTSLKNRIGWEESTEVPAGSDRFGFAAKPAGYKTGSGSFNFIGQDCSFWIAAESSEPNRAPYWNLYFDNDDFLGKYINLKSSAYSVRCLKD